jgi:hypothetical protein
MQSHDARDRPRTCVVVSYWTGRPIRDLYRLLTQMTKIDAGAQFDLVVVCNGGNEEPLSLPSRFEVLEPRVLNRENQGYNLGAWDYGWRNTEGYEYYLFLQDDCFLKRSGWVGDFEFRMANDSGLGLLGEVTMWDRMTWSFIRKSTDRDLGRRAWPVDEPVHPLDTYERLLKEHGISRGEVGTHLCTLILFTTRRVLEEVGGFPYIGPTKREAIACEIAISRLIESHGYRVSKLKDHSFERIGHREATRAHQLKLRLVMQVKGFVKRYLLGKQRTLPGTDAE